MWCTWGRQVHTYLPIRTDAYPRTYIRGYQYPLLLFPPAFSTKVLRVSTKSPKGFHEKCQRFSRKVPRVFTKSAKDAICDKRDNDIAEALDVYHYGHDDMKPLQASRQSCHDMVFCLLLHKQMRLSFPILFLLDYPKPVIMGKDTKKDAHSGCNKHEKMVKCW